MLDVGVVVLGAAAVGAVAFLGIRVGRPEKVESMWVQATLADDGTAEIAELIDYDFGPNEHHGIERIVPQLSPDARITARSDDAPDDLGVEAYEDGARIRVGNPIETVTGQHRYWVVYQFDELAPDGHIGWDVLSPASNVPVDRLEVHLTAPAEMIDLRCFEGDEGTTDRCDIEQVEPGHAVVVVEGLGRREGVTIDGDLGEPLASAPTAPPPPSPPSSDGIPPLPGAAATAGVALLGGVAALLQARHSGRDRVALGGAATAAYAADDPFGASEALLDHSQLAEMATTEFAPPGGLTPSQGGIVLAERTLAHHKVAWLLQAAADGAIDINQDGSGPDDLHIVRTGPGTEATKDVLERMFDGRSEIVLGTYDPKFAKGWARLNAELRDWRKASGFWDKRGEEQSAAAGCLGFLGVALGAVGVFGGWFATARWADSILRWPGLALAVAGALAAGAGIAALRSRWELEVRTPAGSAAWLRVESFRRFLAGSEAWHVEEAARLGVLREYTAWAVALGEAEHWAQAAEGAAIAPDQAGLSHVYIAPLLVSSTYPTVTNPASSSGGGFGGFSGGGGGSVGGGSGGGSVGSW